MRRTLRFDEKRLSASSAGWWGSTQRHAGKVVDIEDGKLRQRLKEIAAEHIRWAAGWPIACCGGRTGG